MVVKANLLQITALLTEVRLEEIMFVANFVFGYLPDKAIWCMLLIIKNDKNHFIFFC